MSAVYRVRQFFRATGAWLRPQAVEDAWLGRYLPAEAVGLFRAMPRHDRQHALNVVRALQQRGYDEPDLLAAALLHDAGKAAPQGGRVRLGHRVAVVLMRAFWPALLERIAQEDAAGWRRPFYVQQHHAAISAQLAQEAGCSPVTVDLIRHHEDPPGPADNSLLTALQAADGTN